MKQLISLDKDDICTRPNGLNFLMTSGCPVEIVLTRAAAEELHADLTE